MEFRQGFKITPSKRRFIQSQRFCTAYSPPYPIFLQPSHLLHGIDPFRIKPQFGLPIPT